MFLLAPIALPLVAGRSDVPFFFISLNTSATGAARTAQMLRAFAGSTTHLELVPAVDGNASAASYAHGDAQYNHLLKRNSMSEVRTRTHACARAMRSFEITVP